MKQTINTYIALLFVSCLALFSYIFINQNISLYELSLEPRTQLADISSTLDNGLVAEYFFEEGSGTTSGDSIGGNTGTLTNGPVWTSGKIGNGAVQLDGVDDYINVPDSNSLSFGNGTSDTPFTFSLWVNRQNGGSSYNTFISKTDTTAANAPFEYSFGINPAGKVAITIYDNSGSNSEYITSDATVSGDIGQWTNYVATYDGSASYAGLKLYRNGVEMSSTGSSPGTYVSMKNTSRNLRIGTQFYSDATYKGFLSGSIDDVRIYNRALSAAEVQALSTYAGGAVSPTPPITPPSGSDTTPPTISITSPVSGTVSNTINITVSASDNVAIAGVQFKLDGNNVGTEVTTAPYSFSLDTTTLSNAAHNITAVARDTSNLNTTSAPVSITVFNNVSTNTCTNGSNWYIDGNTTGSGTGCSWANAWKDFTFIDWTKIQPGHTIWVSGGTYTKGFTVAKSGLAGNPIRIKSSQETGHNGTILLQGGISLNGNNWITIDGAKDDNFASNIGNNLSKLSLIKNNINFKIDTTNNPSSGINMGSGSNITGLIFKWLEISTANSADLSGIRFNPSGAISNVEIAYDWIHDTGQDGINITQNSNVSWDAVIVHHSIIERVADDGMEINAGTTLHHNILGGSLALRGHPDGIQSTGNYQRIYNNIFTGYWLNSFIRSQGWDAEYKGIQIYGNLFAAGASQSPANPVELVWYGNPAAWNTRDVSYWKDWVIANNTFADISSPNAFIISKTRPWLKTAIFQNLLIENNMILNVAPQSAFSISGGNIDPTDLDHCCVVATEADTIFNYNIVAKTSTILHGPYGYSGVGVTSFGYNGVSYANAEALNSSTRYKNNTSAIPSLLNMTGYDYRPSSSDTVARDRGISLAYLNLPGINEDLDGNPRGQGGGWDIGAYEASGGGAPVPTPTPVINNIDNGLVLNLDFNTDDLTSGIFKDQSSSVNNATCQKSLTLTKGSWTATYNQCPSSTVGPDGSTALKFIGGTCDMGSDYLGINRSASLSRLSNGSIAFWGAYDDSTYLNQKFLDTFTTRLSNTWMIGRDGDKYPTLTINDDYGVEGDLFTFPGNNAPNGSWNHYAITWDSNTIKGYYNGTYFGEAPMSGTSALAFADYLAVAALKHNDPRNGPDNNCWTMYGQPSTQAYVYPNAGFLIGRMDDVRIYNRTINSNEVASLASVNTTPSNQVIVSVSKNGSGFGSVGGSGIGCGKHCAESFAPGTLVTLTATPDFGSTFVGWGGVCSGTGTCNVSANSTKYVTATFNLNTTLVATLQAESGIITAPMLVSGNSIYQWTQTIIGSGVPGKAVYTFNVPQAGEYFIGAIVNAPSQANNSFYIKIDGDPVDETSAWFMSTTGGYENRFVSLGGSDRGGNPVKLFNLTAGAHTLVIKGREDGVNLDKINIYYNGIIGNVPTPTPPLTTPDTTLPTVSITSPLAGTTISGSVTLSSTAQDPVVTGQTNSGILGVQFKLDNINLGQELTTAPYSGTWNTIGVPNGNHTLIAIARDVAGNSKTSLPVTVTISNTSVNHPPVANAGNDQVIVLPNTTQLSGSGTDQDNNNLTYSWSKVSGPNIIFSNATIKNPFVTFTTAGTYVLRITVSDGTANSADEVTIIVNDEPIVGIDTDGDGVPNTLDKCPNTPTAIKSKVNSLGCPLPKLTKFTIKTNLFNTDLFKVQSLDLGNNLGRVSFYSNATFSLIRSNGDVELDVDSNLSINPNSIFLDSVNLPELNRPATVTLNNITVKNPQIIKNGTLCSTCNILSYSNNIITFTVNDFSSYVVTEGPALTVFTPSVNATPLPGVNKNTQTVGVLTPTVVQKPATVNNRNTNTTKTPPQTSKTTDTLLVSSSDQILDDTAYQTLSFWDFIKSIFFNTLVFIKQLPNIVWETFNY